MKFNASDGALLYARLIKPAGFAAGKKYPAIVMVYGGPHVQTVRDTLGRRHLGSGAGGARVSSIWQLDNRGSAGRGHKWESSVFRNLGTKELEDQKEGVRYLESLGFVDSGRIGHLRLELRRIHDAVRAVQRAGSVPRRDRRALR